MLLVASAGACWAQGTTGGVTAVYPTKPIRMIVALAAGGGVDTSGRILGQKVHRCVGPAGRGRQSSRRGWHDRHGDSGARDTDGYTLLMSSMGHAITPALYKLSYDAIRDFAPISLFVQSPSVMAVHPSLP